jgi:hypothetical protein
LQIAYTNCCLLCSVGSGYTVFKRKSDAEEAAAKKKRKLIEQRIRPDDKAYFIPSKTWQGSKFDYVFSTRNNSTGYYWDGMDSLKMLRDTGKVPGEPSPENDNEKPVAEVAADISSEPRTMKKKKKKSIKGPVIVEGNSPLDIVANAIRRRDEALQRPPPSVTGLPDGWEKAIDASTARIYYFCRATGARQWEVPSQPADVVDSEVPPAGWKVARDPSSGKEYYYNDKGETRWERPQPE